MIRRIQEIIKAKPQILVVWDSVLILLMAIAVVGVFRGAQLGKGVDEAQFIDEAFTINFADEKRLPFVGSVSGEKYYPVGCRGVSRIKPENKIYFSSVIEAIGAGYSAASGC